jgi:hypothetical protein
MKFIFICHVVIHTSNIQFFQIHEENTPDIDKYFAELKKYPLVDIEVRLCLSVFQQ